MEHGSGGGKVLLGKAFEEGAIEVFDCVIAALVGGVDAPLYFGQLRVARAGSARLIFNVPELEVGAMLAGNAVHECMADHIGVRTVVLVPQRHEAIVENRYVRGRKI